MDDDQKGRRQCCKNGCNGQSRSDERGSRERCDEDGEDKKGA